MMAHVHGAMVSAHAQIAILEVISDYHPGAYLSVQSLARISGKLGNSTANRAIVALRQLGLIRRRAYRGRRAWVVCWSRLDELLAG